MISVYKNVNKKKCYESLHTHTRKVLCAGLVSACSLNLRLKRLLAVFGHTMRAGGGRSKQISMWDGEEGVAWDCYDQIPVLYLSLRQNVAVLASPRSPSCIFKTLTQGPCVSPNLINQNSWGFQDLLFWARFKHVRGGHPIGPPHFKFTKFSFTGSWVKEFWFISCWFSVQKKSFAALMI